MGTQPIPYKALVLRLLPVTPLAGGNPNLAVRLELKDAAGDDVISHARFTRLYPAVRTQVCRGELLIGRREH